MFGLMRYLFPKTFSGNNYPSKYLSFDYPHGPLLNWIALDNSDDPYDPIEAGGIAYPQTYEQIMNVTYYFNSVERNKFGYGRKTSQRFVKYPQRLHEYSKWMYVRYDLKKSKYLIQSNSFNVCDQISN